MPSPASLPNWVLGAANQPRLNVGQETSPAPYDLAGAPVTNVLLVGVGGQGIILASKVLAEALIQAGFDVKMSEIHGMSQRGGSVVTQVRFGKKVFAPLFPKGEADFILAFEKLEALRWLPHLRPGGTVIVNDQAIAPMPVIIGVQKYPEDPVGEIAELVPDTYAVDALAMATALGNAKAANAVLVGLLAGRLGKASGIARETWLAALEAKVPAKHLEVNRAAFLAGYEPAV